MTYLVIGKYPNISLYRCLNENNLEKMNNDFYLDIALCYKIGDIEANAPTDLFINKLDKKYIRYNLQMTLYERLYKAKRHMIVRMF